MKEPKIKLTNTCYEQTLETQTFIVSKGTNQLFEIEVHRDDTSDDIERKIAEKAKKLSFKGVEFEVDYIDNSALTKQE